MWTIENRAKYNRDHLRYPSDVTDEEWAHVEPLIPAAKRGGRKRETDMRQAFNAIMYLLSTGCQWRYIPKDFPPHGAVYRCFEAWSWYGVLDRIHEALYEKCREQAKRDASSTAAIIDSESVKAGEKGGAHRSARIRRGQEDQGQEAPFSHTYARHYDRSKQSSGSERA